MKQSNVKNAVNLWLELKNNVQRNKLPILQWRNIQNLKQTKLSNSLPRMPRPQRLRTTLSNSHMVSRITITEELNMKTNSAIEHELIEEGFNVNTHRFPYTFHHDYVRRGNMSRSDTAQKLRISCVDDNQYDYSACYGAILYLISDQPEKITHRVCDLLEYVKTRIIYNIDGTCDLEQMRKITNID